MQYNEKTFTFKVYETDVMCPSCGLEFIGEIIVLRKDDEIVSPEVTCPACSNPDILFDDDDYNIARRAQMVN